MYRINLILLIWFSCAVSEDFPVFSSKLEVIMFSNNEIEFQLKNRENITDEIRPTKPISLVTSSRQIEKYKQNFENASVPLISSVYFYDKNVVEILRNLMNGNQFINLSSVSQQLIIRYITEWDELISDSRTSEFHTLEHSFPELDTPYITLPKEIEKMFKILRMSARVRNELPVIVALLEYSNLTEVVSEIIKTEMNSEHFFTSKDLTKSAFSMLKLSEMYFRSPTELFEDSLHEIPLKDIIYVSLSDSDVRSLGESLKWLNFAKEHFQNRSRETLSYEVDRKTKDDQPSEKLQTDNEEEHFQLNLNFTDTYLKIIHNILSAQKEFAVDKNETNSLNSFRDVAQMSEEEQSRLKLNFGQHCKNEWVPSFYQALCNGIDLRPVLETSKLTCRYDRLGSSWFYVMPAKIEVLSEEPQVLFFHDVLSESKIKKLQQLALPLQRISGVGESTFDHTMRSSFVTFLDDITQDILDINKITGYLTGLETSEEVDTEIIQVNSYTPGGHYQPHMDSSGEDPPETDEEELQKRMKKYPNGERMATLMFYFNDVPRGGRTVFTRTGVTVVPEKGGALFWSSLFNSGLTDMRGEHAGCPVVEGVKWVANKWIYYNSQWRKRPCSPREERK